SKGEAAVTFAAGNNVRYQQLLRAIEKNGFVVKGADLVADGKVTSGAADSEFEITGSNERFKLEPGQGATPLSSGVTGKTVEVSGFVPEVAKDQTAALIQYTSINEK